MARLRLFREPALWVDRLRAYTLLIDGEPKAAIRQGKTVEIELAPGPHTIRMKIDWATSPELVVDGSRDVNLKCWAASNPLFARRYLGELRDQYIGLDVV